MMETSSEKHDSEAQEFLTKKGLQIIRGLPFSFVFNKEIIEGCLDFVPKDGDVIIATYPKTGTTWMQYIVHQILTKSESFPEFQDMLEKVIPFIEMSGVEAVDALTTNPRVYKHHFPYDAVKKNPKAKIIYVYRRPEDTFVSFYYFMRHINNKLDFDEFFEDYLNGNVSYGSYFHHVLSYWKHRNDGNILMVSYENLSLHRKEEILRIAKFLSEEHYNAIAGNDSIMDSIILNTSFDYMKKNLILYAKDGFKYPAATTDGPTDKPTVDFFRKGVIGDGKKSLKPDQLKRLRERIEETMKDTDILQEWLKE